eukprot:g319.t1
MQQVSVDLSDASREQSRLLSTGTTQYETEITDLRIGTNYFVKIVFSQNGHARIITESQPSEVSDGVQIECPPGAYCGAPDSQGVLINETQNLHGYFKVDNLTFVRCQVTENCIEQSAESETCPKGYRGFMCLKCEKNYIRQGNECNVCGSLGGQIFIAGLAILAGILMFMYLIYKTIRGRGHPKDDQSGIIKIALRQFQLIGIISKFPLSWTSEVQGMFTILGTVSNAGSDVFSLECFMESSYAMKAGANLILPLLVLFFFWTLILSLCSYGSFGKEVCHRYLVLSSIVILMTLHPTLVKQVLDFFQCTQPVSGTSYLISDVDVKCGSTQHTFLLLSMAIPALVIYIIGIPAVAGFQLFKRRHNLTDQGVRETIGFLFSNYTPSCYFWELIVVVRLVLMAAISVIYESNAMVQAILGGQVMFVSTFVHMIFKPFQSKALDLVETYSLATSVACLTCGGLLVNPSTPDYWLPIATILIFVFQIAFIIYAIYMIVVVRRKRKHAESQMSHSGKGKRSTLEEAAARISAAIPSIFSRRSTTAKQSPTGATTDTLHESSNHIELRINPLSKTRSRQRGSTDLTVHL